MTLDKLRDKNVLSFEPEDIRTVHISKDKKTYAIRRNDQPEVKAGKTENGSTPSTAQKPDPIWETDDGRLLDEPVLKRLLSTLARLDCESYINDKKKEDLADPIVIVRLTGSAKEYILSIFSKTDK